MQVENLPIWKALWVGIKIALILLPAMFLFGYFILGHKYW